MAGRQLASKWLKTEALLTDARVAPYIPMTRGTGQKRSWQCFVNMEMLSLNLLWVAEVTV